MDADHRPLAILGQGDFTRTIPVTPQKDEPKKQLLTHSRMQAFKTCPKKHYYAYELAIRPIETAAPLRLGSAIHLGLDLRKQGRSGAEAVLAAMKPYDFRPDWVRDEDTLHAWEVERETVGCLLGAYFWRWEIDNLPPELTVAEVVSSEFSFTTLIRNPATGSTSRLFNLAGKVDAIVRLGDGRLAILEHKTCSEDIAPTADYWHRLRMDQQISLYMHAVQTEGFPVETVLYDVIRKPTIRPELVDVLDENGCKIVIDSATGERCYKSNLKKDGTPGAGHGEPYQSANKEKGWLLQSRRQTPAEWGEKLSAHIAANPDWYFARREIPRLRDDIREFAEELWQVQQTIRLAQIDGRHYRNTGACRFNNSTCPYFKVCPDGIDQTRPPAGFERVKSLHPELEQP